MDRYYHGMATGGNCAILIDVYRSKKFPRRHKHVDRLGEGRGTHLKDHALREIVAVTVGMVEKDISVGTDASR